MSNSTTSPYDQYESPFPRNRWQVTRLRQHLSRIRFREHRLNYGIYKFFRGFHYIYRLTRTSVRHKRLRYEISHLESRRGLLRPIQRLFQDDSQRTFLLIFLIMSVVFAFFSVSDSLSQEPLTRILDWVLAFFSIFSILYHLKPVFVTPAIYCDAI